MQMNSGVCPGPERCGAAEDVVADGELGDGCADRFDLSRQLGAQDPLLRSAEAKEQADEEWLGCTNAAVGPGDRRGVNLDEDLVRLWEWASRPLRVAGRPAARTCRRQRLS